MLYGLFSQQTNLPISSHDQSDILQHNGTNYEQLLFSSDIWAGTSAMGICSFFYMWHWFGEQWERGGYVHMWNGENSETVLGLCSAISVFLYMRFSVVVLQQSMLKSWGSICLGYMCIHQYVKLIQCTGTAWIYDQLMGGPSAMGIFASFNKWNLFGVVVLHGSMINWQEVQSALGICALCYMWNLFGVVVFQRSMLHWRRGWGQSAIDICDIYDLPVDLPSLV